MAACGGYLTLRVHTGTLSFETPSGKPFDLLAAVESIKQAGTTGVWTAYAKTSPPIQGCLCALRKTEEAIQEAVKRILKVAQNKGCQPREKTLRYAPYVMVFTTFPAETHSEKEILEWYRLHWQVELIFKRFKSLAQRGHPPQNG